MDQRPLMEHFEALAERLDLEDYNFAHFKLSDLAHDMRGTLKARGRQPGTPAPSFCLPRSSGGDLALDDHIGRPMLLRFGSRT
ncbi:MAG: hypothetical protein MUD01_12505 [Chloroflexaceae bacterium]|jgi:hypothetical protein|nr:hypothetical protein [Chloroflexaceae bacterium]